MKKIEKAPVVSILLSAHNEQDHIDEAINSLLLQTYKDFELLITDDGSTDKTLLKIEALAKTDGRISIIKNDSSKGLANCLNEMIKLSKGRYLARMDGDDIARKDRLQKQVEFLNRHNDVGIVGSFCREIDTAGNPISVWTRPTTDRDIRKALFKYNPFIHSSVLIRKEVFEDIGLYNPTCRYAQDIELWLRIGSKFNYAIIPDPLIDLRVDWNKLNKKNRLARKIKLKIMYDFFRTSYYPSWYKLYLIHHLVLYLLPTRLLIILKKIQRWIRYASKSYYQLELK